MREWRGIYIKNIPKNINFIWGFGVGGFWVSYSFYLFYSFYLTENI
jgi:hypothetical protein